MSIHTVHGCKIGGKKARLYVYRNYGEKASYSSAPINYPWSIYLDDEGDIASGTGATERDASDQLWQRVDELRRERRKKR